MKPVKCAIVGVGMMGKEHADILAASPMADLVIACDTSPSARHALPDGVALVESLEHALATPGLEAVVIATPQSHHRTAVSAAVKRGLAVFCEKPIAHSLEDADAICEMGMQPDARVVIGHCLRFDPRYRAIKEATDSGILGKPVQITARTNVPDFEGALLASRTSLAIENGVHLFDLMQWLVGPIVRVYAEATATFVLGEQLVDSIAMTVRFRCGAVGTYASSWLMPSKLGYPFEHFFSLQGSEGLAWIDERGSGTGIVGPGSTHFPSSISYRDPSGVPYGLYRTEIEAFLRGVRDSARWLWPITLAEARAALVVALAADDSIRLGQPIAIGENLVL